MTCSKCVISTRPFFMILSLRWKDFFHRSHHEVILSLLLKCLWCQEELLHLCFTGVCVCVLGGFWLPLRSSNKCNSIHSGVSVCVAVFLLEELSWIHFCENPSAHACFYQGFTKENRSRVEKLRCSAEIAKNRSVFKISDILHRYSYASFAASFCRQREM